MRCHEIYAVFQDPIGLRQKQHFKNNLGCLNIVAEMFTLQLSMITFQIHFSIR